MTIVTLSPTKTWSAFIKNDMYTKRKFKARFATCCLRPFHVVWQTIAELAQPHIPVLPCHEGGDLRGPALVSVAQILQVKSTLGRQPRLLFYV